MGTIQLEILYGVKTSCSKPVTQKKKFRANSKDIWDFLATTQVQMESQAEGRNKKIKTIIPEDHTFSRRPIIQQFFFSTTHVAAAKFRPFSRFWDAVAHPSRDPWSFVLTHSISLHQSDCWSSKRVKRLWNSETQLITNLTPRTSQSAFKGDLAFA